MPGDPHRPPAQGRRCHRAVIRSLHPPWRAGPHSIRQWPRVHRGCRAGMDCCRRCQDSLHRARQPVGERLYRELQRPPAGRAAQWRDLLQPARGPDRARKLAAPLQHRTSPRFTRLSRTGARSLHARLRRVGGCATPASSAGHAPIARYSTPEPTFEPDHSFGAGHADAYEYYLQGRATLIESFGSNATLRAARDLFAKAIEIDAGYAKAYAGIADCDALLWANGDPEVSFEHLIAMSDKAMELAPNLAEAHAARGVAYHVAGRPEVAVPSLQQAIERDPLLFGAHFWLGLSRRDLGQLGEAAALFQRAAELRPDDFASLGLLADVYEAQGRHHESQSAARRGLIRIEAILKQRPTATDVLS